MLLFLLAVGLYTGPFCFGSVAAVTTAVVMIIVAAAAVGAADMAFAVVVVIAADIGVIAEHTEDEALNCTVCIAAYTAVKLDAGLSQCILCARADAAADEDIYAEGSQQTCQCAVTAAVGVNNFGRKNLFALYFVELELLGVAKMLEYAAVFIGYCNFHGSISLKYYSLFMPAALRCL